MKSIDRQASHQDVGSPLSPDMHERLAHMPEFMGLSVPIHRASTLRFKTVEDFSTRRGRLFDGFSYGLYGTPTVRYMEQEIAKLEGGSHCLATPSGLSAVNLPLLALLQSGDHILVAQNAYATTREFCQSFLSRIGITHSIVPADAVSVQPWMTPATRMILLESPGSYTMEVQDMERIAHEAHQQGALVIIDNAWGLGLTRPFEYGVDVVCNALSKYAGGHSDACMGSVTVNDRALYERLKTASFMLGEGVSSDDAWLVLRGLQTFDVRLAEHARRAIAVANLLAAEPAVQRVICPHHPDDKQYRRFTRYFSGGNGLLSVVLRAQPDDRVIAMVEGFKMFRIGASWGGTHSLVAPMRASSFPWLPEDEQGSWLLRFHVGLEPLDLLLNDLKEGFAQLTGG